jgi:hypothetical protein
MFMICSTPLGMTRQYLNSEDTNAPAALGRDTCRSTKRLWTRGRVFYDVSGTTVEILAIVSKSETEAWLAQFETRE